MTRFASTPVRIAFDDVGTADPGLFFCQAGAPTGQCLKISWLSPAGRGGFWRSIGEHTAVSAVQRELWRESCTKTRCL